jgi:uncharacterized YigZ family protein
LNKGQYYTIENPTDFEATISRSHFIASLRFASSRDKFEEELKKIVALFPKATHYCWAYRFVASGLEHSSDAGEPSGTAGRPILGALKKYSLLNVMAVVTRFYGGVKLGVRGLIAAYGETTLGAIANADIVIKEPRASLKFSCSYDYYNSFLSILQKYRIKIDSLSPTFEEVISGEILIPTAELPAILDEFDNMRTRGSMFKYFIGGE